MKIKKQISITKNSFPNDKTDTVIIRAEKGLRLLEWRELWEYRELLYFLAWRDVKIRYKQTVLGIMWVLLQPIASSIVFSGLFGVLLKVSTQGIPYPIFVMSGLLIWTYFSSTLIRCAGSLVQNANLVSKVYFPRILIPLGVTVSGLVDLFIGFFAAFVTGLFFGILPTWRFVFLPVLLFQLLITTLGFGLWLAAVNVRYRDVNHLLPFVLQIWLYITPVVYPVSLISLKTQELMTLNPVYVIVEEFRWIFLGMNYSTSIFESNPEWFVLSLMGSIAVFISGLFFFRRIEQSFADVI